MATLVFKKVSETLIRTTPEVQRPSIACGPDGLLRIACDAHYGQEIWFWEESGSSWREQLLIKSVRVLSKPPKPYESPTSRSYVPQVKTWRLPNNSIVSVVSSREGIKEYGPESNYGPALVVIPSGQTCGPYLNKAFCKGAARIEVMPDGRLFLMSKDGVSRIYTIKGTSAVETGTGLIPVGLSGEKIDLCILGSMMIGCAGGFGTVMSSCYCDVFGHRDWCDCTVYRFIGDDIIGYPGMGVKPGNGMVYLAHVGDQCYVNKITAEGRVMFNPSKLPSLGAGTPMDRHMTQFLTYWAREVAVWTNGGTIMAADVDAVLTGGKAQPICRGDLAAAVNYPGGMALAVVTGGELSLVKVQITKVK